jgi:hypothetical protein
MTKPQASILTIEAEVTMVTNVLQQQDTLALLL